VYLKEWWRWRRHINSNRECIDKERRTRFPPSRPITRNRWNRAHDENIIQLLSWSSCLRWTSKRRLIRSRNVLLFPSYLNTKIRREYLQLLIEWIRHKYKQYLSFWEQSIKVICYSFCWWPIVCLYQRFTWENSHSMSTSHSTYWLSWIGRKTMCIRL
jgi:hypothetical protein